MAKDVVRFARDETAPRFERPDALRIARALDLKRRAKDADGLFALERDIVAKTNEGAARVNVEAQRFMAQAEANARGSASIAPLDADKFISGAELGIATVEARLFEPLVHARLEERRRLAELRRFKQAHKLERDASYAETALQPAANLALLVAAESAANALLLQTASSGGYVGGFLIAVIMSIVTVAMGALFAGLLGIRLMRRSGIGFRTLGGAIFGGALIFAGLWAFALARYRDLAVAAAAGLHAPKGKKAAAANYTGGLFGAADGPVLGFGSLESLALVVLGAVVFVLAAMKGAGGRGGFTDSYWGYKPRHAAHRAAEESYQDEQEDFREALEEVIDEFSESLEAAADAGFAQAARTRALCNDGLSANIIAETRLSEWRSARSDLLRQIGVDSSNDSFTLTDNTNAIVALQSLASESDQIRTQNTDAANAARRALRDLLNAALERLAERVAAAEQEASKRFEEEMRSFDANKETTV